MTIMGAEPANPADSGGQKLENVDSGTNGKSSVEETSGNIFSDENIGKSESVQLEDPGESGANLSISSEDKVAFIDSIIGNKRFTKDYSLFGGKLKLTLRSLTTDEVNAMSAWLVKDGVSDSAGLMTGRYRKYLAAAQVERMNGIEMPALEEPLFETLNSDGKTTTPPGWIKRNDYWENMSSGLFDTVIRLIREFDALYSTLCNKAEDVNFWSPDTP